MPRKKILLTVKTYPAISEKYSELVCTAGLTEDGDWIRIYPVPFRKLAYQNQYKKYEWREFNLMRNNSDFRPETYRPIDVDELIPTLGRVGTENGWAHRNSIVLKNIYTDLTKLINDAKDKNKYTSLATFKPTVIHNFVWEEAERDWKESQKDALKQQNLFEVNKDDFSIVRKLPYKFSYIFEDCNGKRSKLMIEDWETGMLFWNCFKRHQSEARALEDVKKKYFNDFSKTKDLHFFLGTTKLNHLRAPNPFIIIGTYHPPQNNQIELFD